MNDAERLASLVTAALHAFATGDHLIEKIAEFGQEPGGCAAISEYVDAHEAALIDLADACVTDAQRERVNHRFLNLLAERHPEHPWVANRPDARLST